MFDTFFGLPVHILVIHAVVVIGPLAALTAIAYVIRPTWRPALTWPLVASAIVTGLTGFVAASSGEELAERQGFDGENPASAPHALAEHMEAGSLLRIFCLALMALALVTVWVLRRQESRPLPAAVTWALLGLLSVSAVAVVIQAVIAGHSGAQSVWGG